MKLGLDSGHEGYLDWLYSSFPEVMKNVKGATQVYFLPKKSSQEDLIQAYIIENPKSLVTCLTEDRMSYSPTQVFIYGENEQEIKKAAEMILKAAGKKGAGFLYETD